MAIKNYITNNKKKSICIITSLMMLIAAAFIIIYVNNAKAGVFVEDENGNKVQKNEIHVLEIVAEYGQQILGYTVKGQEPITIEAITRYEGDMDINIQDFANATGYVLRKQTLANGKFKYTVERSLLNDTFNRNVLGDSMAEGEIKVKTVQANELTLKDINEANLIYINSNDYNDNLMYYYDQFMREPEERKGYQLGDKGNGYNDSYITTELRSAIAIRNICAAAGNKVLAETLTDEDFVLSGAGGYNIVYLKAYKKAIAQLSSEAFNGNDNDETLNNISTFLTDTTQAEKTAAVNYLLGRAGRPISDAEKEEVGDYIQTAGYDYNEKNLDEYCRYISTTRVLTDVNLQNRIRTINSQASTDAAQKLVQIKNRQQPNGTGVTQDDLEDVKDCFMVLMCNNRKDILISEYADAFFNSTFSFTNPSNPNTTHADLQALVDNVNGQQQAKALEELADAAGDEDRTAEFTTFADIRFEAADVEGYNKYYIDAYIEALEAITDVTTFRPDSSDTGYDLEKIKTFISDVNVTAVNKTIKRSCDLSWTAVKGIYNYAMLDEKGLMYNTELLTNNTLGDYSQDFGDNVVTADDDNTSVVDNTNNMYKMLLLMRQLQSSYYVDNVASCIDDAGVYYPDGVDADGNFIGLGINSWYKETFGTDFSNTQKYHEPDVVGQTYALDGTQGAEKNYVHKRIYSFTGTQFFGGERFLETDVSGIGSHPDGVVTPNTGYSDNGGGNLQATQFDENSNVVFFDAAKTSSYGLWISPWAHIWSPNADLPMEVLDASKSLFKIQIPNGQQNLIFNKGNNTWQNYEATAGDLLLPSEYSGMTYYCTGDTTFYGSTRYVVETYKGLLTKSINVGASANPSEDKIVKYDGEIFLQLVGYNISNAKYMIDNSGTWIPIQIGSSFKLGSGISSGTTTNVKLMYDTGAGSVTCSYYYRKLSDTYSVDISNIKNGSIVEYCGNMDIDITYSGAEITDFKYSVDGGAAINVPSGTHINIGSDKEINTRTRFVFTYKVAGIEKTVTTTLFKMVPEYVSPDETNYLSKKTATAIDALSADATCDDYLNNILQNGNKGDMLKYIMKITLNEYVYPLNILEIEPGASVTVLDTYEGAKKLAEYLNADINTEDLRDDRKRKEYFNVTYMSVKEFNTRNEDLTAKYDFIYIGVDSGYVRVRNYSADGENFYRTSYQDSTMNGLVYTGIGDRYGLTSLMRGVAADDYTELTTPITNFTQQMEVGYWKNYLFDGFTDNTNADWNLDRNKNYVLKTSEGTTRLGGVDLTVRSKDKLINYLKAGYPVLLADEIMYCDDSSRYVAAQEGDTSGSSAKKWRYVDVNSKMYAFVQEAKNLGNSGGTYDGKDADGNPVFLDGKTYPSLVSESFATTGRNPENLSDAHKLEGGLGYAILRTNKVEFELAECPTQYNKNADGSRVGHGSTGHTIAIGSTEFTNYHFTLNIKSNADAEWMKENYEYVLYVDKSGVGKFEEDDTIELYPTEEYVTGTDGQLQVVLSGQWPSNIEGFIPWKIEAYNKANREQKFSYIGFSAFEIATQKDVYVLWVRTEYPSSRAFNLDFTQSIRNNAGYITDYNIHILSMRYSQFTAMWPPRDTGAAYTSDNSLLKVKKVAEYCNRILNVNEINQYCYELPRINDNENEKIDINQLPDDSELNMIVVGFSDTYANEDIKNINALKNIEYFINAGNSLLFTHDNSSYLSTMNYYQDGNGRRIGTLGQTLTPDWGRYTSAYMRSMLGMDLYGVTHSSSNLPESSKNARMYLSDDITQADLRGFTELCSFHYTSNTRNLDNSHWGEGNLLYAESSSGQPHSSNIKYELNRWAYTHEVMKVNEGQITEYPFVLDELIDTAETHAQYMQIDMEDADTTVWFTLNNATRYGGGFSNAYYKYTKGDGANNYYIYSSGNITYTGSGHSTTESITQSEQKLFINTIIAALKAGNYAPNVDFPYARAITGGTTTENYMEYYPDNPNVPGFILTFKPTDYDSKNNADDVFSACKIYIDVNEDGIYSAGDILLNDSDVYNGVSYSRYIKDTNNTGYITLEADRLVNGGLHSFLITKEDIANIETEIGRGANSIYQYKIYVEVTDNGTKKSTEARLTGKNSVKIQKEDYIMPEYFNLN